MELSTFVIVTELSKFCYNIITLRDIVTPDEMIRYFLNSLGFSLPSKFGGQGFYWRKVMLKFWPGKGGLWTLNRELARCSMLKNREFPGFVKKHLYFKNAPSSLSAGVLDTSLSVLSKMSQQIENLVQWLVYCSTGTQTSIVHITKIS